MYPTYSLNRSLNFSHIDHRGWSRPSALFDLMQEAATEHAYALGIDKDSLQILWVLSRMKASQTRPILPGEPIVVRTVFDGVKGVTWHRSFYFTDRSGMEIAHATSSWVMLDIDGRHILRPKNVPSVMPFAVAPGAQFQAPGKLTCGALTPHHVHTVRYSDLDVNGHLNNVKIVDVIADGLALEQHDGLFVSEIQVNYTAECLCGEQISVSVGATEDGGKFVFGQTASASKFEALARLSHYEGKV